MRGRKVKSRDCALASDLVRAALSARASRLSTYKVEFGTFSAFKGWITALG